MERLQELLHAAKNLGSDGVIPGIVSTIILIALVLLVRWFLARSLRKNENLAIEVRRRWLVQMRNAAFLLVILGLVIIWAQELRLLAVSMLAVAVATVIATKELIQCISGSVMKAASRAFTIGDRIEIAGLRGDVIDSNAFTTTVLEIGPNQLTQQLTGRAIVIPNSMFLDKPVINETFTDDFVLHVFKVPVDVEHWQASEQDLIAAATAECEIYLTEARQHFSKLKERSGLFTILIEPRVTLAIPKSGELELIVRIPVPARKKGRIEQAVLRNFLTAATKRARAASDAKPDHSISSDDSINPTET